MNGNQMIKPRIAHKTAKTAAFQSPPLPTKAPIPTGEGQGIWANIGRTISNLIAKYANDADAIGAKKNGTAK